MTDKDSVLIIYACSPNSSRNGQERCPSSVFDFYRKNQNWPPSGWAGRSGGGSSNGGLILAEGFCSCTAGSSR